MPMHLAFAAFISYTDSQVKASKMSTASPPLPRPAADSPPPPPRATLLSPVPLLLLNLPPS